MQGCRADQQILERELDVYPFLLPLDAPSQPRDGERHGMHWYVARQAVDELQPSLLLRLCFRAIGSMHQLGDGHDRHADFDLALSGLHLFQDFPNGMASAFGSNNNAGVEDYSHAGGFHGLRWLTISSTSSAKSGSRTGALPVSTSCALAKAMPSEMLRRTRSAACSDSTGPSPFSIMYFAPPPP